MHKTLKFVFVLLVVSIIGGFVISIYMRNKCFNNDNFEEFYYNDSLYSLPDNYDDIYDKYNFYGTMHKIGYTIGVYSKVFDTYVLDNDTEENILFQKNGAYFWLKEDFDFPDLSKSNIAKLLAQKLDDKNYVLKEEEFLLENILLNDLFEEYSIDASKDSFLLDSNNYSTYRIKYFYENGISTNDYYKITFYNDNIIFENIYEKNKRVFYMLNKNCSLRLYEFILNNL